MGQNPIYLKKIPLLYKIDLEYNKEECEFWNDYISSKHEKFAHGIREYQVTCLRNGESGKQDCGFRIIKIKKDFIFKCEKMKDD